MTTPDSRSSGVGSSESDRSTPNPLIKRSLSLALSLFFLTSLFLVLMFTPSYSLLLFTRSESSICLVFSLALSLRLFKKLKPKASGVVFFFYHPLASRFPRFLCFVFHFLRFVF